MATKDGARIKETSTSSGTGSVDLGGAVVGHNAIVDEVGDGNSMFYWMLDANGVDWEVGVGVVTAGSPDTLSRDTVVASSNGGSKIPLTSPTGGDFHLVFNAPVPGAATGDVNFFGNKIRNFSEPVPAVASVSGNVTIDASVSGIQRVLLTENVTGFTLANFEAGKAVSVYFEQDATGGRTVDFNQFNTSDGGEITLTTDANKRDLVVIITPNGVDYDAALSMGALAALT